VDSKTVASGYMGNRRSAIRELYRRLMQVRVRMFFRDYNRLRVEKIGGIEIIVLPDVFNGVLLRTGAFLAETLNAATVPASARVLDLGTGSGIGAVFAARYAARVIATDINPAAVRCAQINALAQHLEQKIETRVGDLFEPVRGERFDLILFNPPFYRGRPRNLTEHAWRSVDVFDRFLRELPAHLTAAGRARVVVSSDGEIADALRAAHHLSARVIRRRDLINEVLTVYEMENRERR
jgi:release factor glutamine methyltransferase